MQQEGYSSKGRPLVKTSKPGIYRRGGQFVVVYRDPSGKQRKKAAPTMKAAVEVKKKEEGAVANGEWRETSRATFADFARDWIGSYGGRTRRGIEEDTRASYQASLEADAIPYFGKTRLTAITAQDVKRFAVHVADRGVSAATVQRAVAPVRCLLADAHEAGLIRSNPAAGLRLALPPSTRRSNVSETEDDEGEVKALSDAELALLLGETPDEWELLFEFLSEAGLRIGEAAELRRRDVDLEQRWLHVRRRYYGGKIGCRRAGKRVASG